LKLKKPNREKQIQSERSLSNNPWFGWIASIAKIASAATLFHIDDDTDDDAMFWSFGNISLPFPSSRHAHGASFALFGAGTTTRYLRGATLAEVLSAILF
jgi:hypothetical protein